LLTFQDLISKYDESLLYCHPQAHHLGMFLYDYIGDLSEALSHADQQCGGAAIHGMVQSFFMAQVAKGMSPADIDITKICPENAENPYAREREECLHAIGHGLADSYDYDVFVAVQACDELEPGWEQTSCSKGLFMENVDNYYKSGVGAIDEDDLLFPCNVVDAKYAPACYYYSTTHIINQKGEILNNSFEECDKIIPEEFVKYCYRGIGRQMFGYAVSDLERSLILCQIGQPHYQTDCFKGMVMTLVDHRGSDEGFRFCKLLPEEFKVDCYDAMGKWAIMLHPTPDGIAEECSKAESLDYFDVCMNSDINGISHL